MNNPKIGAVVVLYKPDLKVTKQVIKSISSQVEEICIVDNTPNQNIKEEFLSIINIHYLSLGENKGIAAAQNIGISYLKNKNFEFVLFCDQDSLAPSDTVKKLFDGYRILKNEGIRIATVGTRAINKLTGEKYRSRTKELGNPLNPKNYRNQYCKITECYSVMSSISLTLINNFEEVGPFDETLFIDGVDDEWCWRAWHFKKLRSFIIENATIMHMLGEKDSFLGKNISISTPFRIYFHAHFIKGGSFY